MTSFKILIRPLFWKTLLLFSPSQYERRKAKSFKFAYPDYFTTTKSIFIHVPKAAGTSVGMALYGRQTHHLSWQEWHEFNPEKFKHYFKFAIIRDPISRFASSFYYLKRGGMNAVDKEFGETVLPTFDTPNDLAKALVDNGLQKQILNWLHFRPQAEFVADERGQSKVDLLIKFEKLDAGFKHVAQKLNFESTSLPHLNRTKTQPEVSLEKEARDILNCLYRKDFVLWERHTL